MKLTAMTYIIFFAVLIPSALFAVSFSKIMWIEILKVVAIKSPRIFRFMTCGTKDVTTFKALHMNCEDDEKDNDNFEVKNSLPREDHLVGFGTGGDNFSSALKNKIERRRIMIIEKKR